MGNGHASCDHTAVVSLIAGAWTCMIAVAPAAIETAARPRIISPALSFVCRKPTTVLAASSIQPGGGPRLTGQLEDVHSRIGAIHNVDVPPIVGLAIVRLDCDLAAIVPIHLHAPFVGGAGDRWDEGPDFLRK